jgi:inner membrane protein
MASAFSHALVAITIGKNYSKKYTSLKFWLLAATCAVLPDADVLSFQFGIPYNHFLGHRGFFHSLFFSLFIGILTTFLFYRKIKLTDNLGLKYITFFFLCGASHALLDMLTNGGLGVAIFSPFDTTRYFFPWRPIQVSPIGIQNFMGERGIRVIRSELVWVGIPCFIYFILIWIVRKIKSRNTQSD